MVKIYMEYIHAAFLEYCGGRDTVTISAEGSERRREHARRASGLSGLRVRPRIRKAPSEQSQSTTELPWRPVAEHTAMIGRVSVKGLTGGILLAQQ